ncbi:hypothetical protein QAD02_020807 [Eretmocerus hayati]|uniref:Uncharacterized protein n=1 Tax=Eretmocerus hayati TaxID=131215 RepID=A0ACC2PN36_9HYME|nr:hypothetical protein QAD02_020807 [Eretmocerus hayati]
MEDRYSMYNFSKADLDRELMKLTLSMYDDPLLSRKAVDNNFNKFDRFISDQLIPYLLYQMSQDLKPVTDLKSYYKAQFILENNKNSFNKFSTEHLRFKVYKEKSVLVEPESFEIGEEKVYTYNAHDQAEVSIKKLYAVHVPLPESFKVFLEIPGVFEKIELFRSELQQDTQFLSNVMQALIWKQKYAPSHPLKIVYPLEVYIDEFEPGDGMGSHAGEQKLVGVYVSISCLPPSLAAELENIFLSTLFYSKYSKKCESKNILRKLIEELNFLSEHGISIEVNGQKFQIYFELTWVIGDNAALNEYCGYVKSFMALLYCRICTATSDQCKVMCIEDPSLVRVKESYETDLLKNDPQSTGLNEYCLFNDVRKFHIYENISGDAMHDFMGGAAVYTATKTLGSLFKDKTVKFDIDVVNNRINRFPYNEAEKGNKPRPLFFTHQKGGSALKIKQSASEMLCLVRYLPLMIGDLIPAGNVHWKLFLYLTKIAGIMTSPKISRSELISLEKLIEKHNSLYFSLYGHLKPKMHFLLHYIRIMLMQGPIIHFATFKFERKNRDLKQVALGTSCNTNLPLTIAIRHQLQQCYRTECNVNLDDIIPGSVQDADASNEYKLLFPDSTIYLNKLVKTPVVSLKNVNILGKVFCPGTIFVTRMTEQGPIFATLTKIFYADRIIFCCQEFETLYFNHYYHAYSVSSRSKRPSLALDLDSVPKLPPCLYVSKVFDDHEEEFVATRYNI